MEKDYFIQEKEIIYEQIKHKCNELTKRIRHLETYVESVQTIDDLLSENHSKSNQIINIMSDHQDNQNTLATLDQKDEGENIQDIDKIIKQEED